jgi:hypothetical protein
MFPERLLSSLAVGAVIMITAGFFILVEPEEFQKSSSDGVVTVTGLARQTQPLQVELGDKLRLPLLGSAYALTPDSLILDEPAVIAFKVSDREPEVVSGLSIYRLHPDLQMWERVSPVVSHTDEILAVETSQLGSFALGDQAEFVAPVFANVYEELRAMAPAQAVGYETAVGYKQRDRETLRLTDIGEAGGCNGTVRVGDGQEISQLEREATVDIAGEQQRLTFVFVTRWFTASSGGCAATEPLKPLTEYDILEEIQK